MAHLTIKAFVPTFALTIAACGYPMNTPDIKHNPRPKMHYDVILTIKDAPGPFDSVKGKALYDVTNEKCSPIDRFAGVYLSPSTHSEPLFVTQASDQEYIGKTYLDLLKDEDYYGLGICHWMLDRVIFSIKYVNAEFVASILRDEIIARHPKTIYLRKESYIHSETASSAGNSTLMRDVVRQHPHLFFQVTITAKESFE